MDELFRRALADGGLIALPVALVGGVVATLNPCCLPLYPAATATCCAAREASGSRTVTISLSMAAGMAFATALLGMGAAWAGARLAGAGSIARYALAILPLVAGLHLVGWIRLPAPPLARLRGARGPLGIFAAGFLLSLILSPGDSPIMAAILGFAAYRGDVVYGALLLFAYGLGVSLPVLLLGPVVAAIVSRLERRGLRPWVDRATGATFLGVAAYIVWRA